MAKKQADGSAENKKKKVKMAKLKKVLAARHTAKPKAPAENPFETIWSRRKFDVLGKKRKGEERRVGLARSLGIEKRKKTLLKEYEQSKKSSLFLDKRIGEQNEGLEEFDKAIMRFQRERQLKQSKKNKYNLSDGEEDELAPKDDYEDELSPDEEEDAPDNAMDSFVVNDAGEMRVPSGTEQLSGVEHKNKSKKEVMEEIILKSKFFKAQKAKDKEENEQMMEQLDKDFTSLAQSEALLSLTQPGKMNALKALLNKSNVKESAKEETGSITKESLKKEQPDAYDRLVKEMVLDMRARPSDRTKTPDEIAQEEREELERLEEERKKRMLGDDASSDEGSDDDEVLGESQQNSRPTSGDDLGDSFSVDEHFPKKKGWVDEVLQGKSQHDEHGISFEESEDGEGEDNHEGQSGNESNDDDDDDDDQSKESDEDDDPSSNLLATRDWEQSDEEDFGTDLDEKDGVEKLEESKDKKTTAKPPSTLLEALPFVIEAPKSLEGLSLLLDNRSDTEIVEAISRIRKCNAIRLGAENRKKMQLFYGVLLQYFAVIASRKPLNLKLINLLLKPLMEMSVDTPYFAAICARQRIVRMRSQFCEDIKNPEKNSWPSLKTLLLLKLWSTIFPCSDFRHSVMTPATLLMCEYLMRSPIRSGQDIAIGTFLCSMVLLVTRQSQKFCAEALMFLQKLLMFALENKDGSHHDSLWYHWTDLKALNPWLRIRNNVSDIRALDFLSIMGMPADASFFSSDSFRASVLVSVVEMLRGFANIYCGFSSFPEIFSPILVLLHEILQEDNCPELLQVKMREVADLIERKVNEHYSLRQPLQMRKQKPVPIKLLTPKFEENFVKGRDYDPDREKAERRKLKKRLKQEAKGAARELRKDNTFVFDLKERERLILEEQTAEKYGKARAFLQEQEHAFKSGQLGKGRKRRR